MASGGTSSEVNVVKFSECILTFRCGSGKCHGMVAVFAIGVRRVLLGAIDGAIAVEIPGPGGYIAC